MNAGDDAKQRVWKEAPTHNPDWLILGGDNIYMNYGPAWFGPRRWSPSKFATTMLARYSEQFSVPSFRALIESIPAGQVIGVWDDHDFGWNNCYGTSLDDEMPAKSLIARAMFHHYFAELNKRPLATSLPPLSLPGSSANVYRGLDVGPLRVLLCDGRTYREKNSSNPAAASLLGAAQETWLFNEIAGAALTPKPVLIVSGSTMTDAGDQSWDFFADFFQNRFLPATNAGVVMFLGGDVHENRLPPRPTGFPVEIVSSGAALGVIFRKRNFGVLDVSTAEARIFLFEKGAIQYYGHLDLVSGAFATSG
jgi:hypothetical protein